MSTGSTNHDEGRSEFNFQYPFLHWLLSVVLGPLFIVLYGWLKPGVGIEAAVQIAGISALSATALSMPLLIGYLFFFNWLYRQASNHLLLRSVSAVMVIVPFGLIMNWIGGTMMMLVFICYSAAILIAGLLVPIRPRSAHGPAR